MNLKTIPYRRATFFLPFAAFAAVLAWSFDAEDYFDDLGIRNDLARSLQQHHIEWIKHGKPTLTEFASQTVQYTKTGYPDLARLEPFDRMRACATWFNKVMAYKGVTAVYDCSDAKDNMFCVKASDPSQCTFYHPKHKKSIVVFPASGETHLHNAIKQ